MGVLAEYLRSEAASLKEEASRRGTALTEWLDAIDRLYAQLQIWLREADAGAGMLRFRESEKFITEGAFGSYPLRQLHVELNSRAVTVSPRARRVVATIHPPDRPPRRADGMVEIFDGYGPPAEYYLFRSVEGGVDRWYVRNAALWNSVSSPGIVEPLDRDRLEAVVLSVLK